MSVLTEKTREVSVIATGTKDNFAYNVEYKLSNGSITRVACNVYKRVIENEMDKEQYLGYMVNESGNQQYVFPEKISITPHVIMFEEILKEVKEGVETE